jgi:hypothetical protein
MGDPGAGSCPKCISLGDETFIFSVIEEALASFSRDEVFLSSCLLSLTRTQLGEIASTEEAD